MKRKGRKQNNKPPDRLTRRQFIELTGAIAGAAAIGSVAAGCAGSPVPTTTTSSHPATGLPQGTIISPDTLRADRIPPGQHQVENWPVLQAGGVRQIDPSEWQFTVSGLVENEMRLDYGRFEALEMVYVFSDVHCVTTWSKLGNLWRGVSSRTIIDMANPKSGAAYVIVQAQGGFTTNLTLDDFLEEDVLFALEHDRSPLAAQHGGPVRLVVPRLYFWKSAKWVTGIELTAEDHPGYWESRGYNNHGDPWAEERFSL